MGVACVSHMMVVKQQLNFFSPLFFFSPPLGKHASSTKIKSNPSFSSYFNYDPYSFDFS
jgi:hypothetical protein